MAKVLAYCELRAKQQEIKEPQWVGKTPAIELIKRARKGDPVEPLVDQPENGVRGVPLPQD